MGSLYTSICPTLCLEGMGEAIAGRNVPKVRLTPARAVLHWSARYIQVSPSLSLACAVIVRRPVPSSHHPQLHGATAGLLHTNVPRCRHVHIGVVG